MVKELLLSDRDMKFLLYDFLDCESLLQFDRYKEHDRSTFDAVIDTAKKMAEEKFAPFAAKLDANEPKYINGQVEVIEELQEALDAYVEAGFTGIAADSRYGGMQYPWIIAQAACAYIAAADVSANAYGFLTHAAINLLSKYGDEEQKKIYLRPMVEGRYFGTMCLSEPQAGSSLSDIKVRAKRSDQGHYLLSGTKMWISGGEHNLSENIVNLVLAKVPGAAPGVAGISLFVVPKYRINADGTIGEKNNISLGGLNHKMGFRGTVNTVLNFGETGDCYGYLVGEENKGLFYMFHMMNEARIGVGMTATVLGYTGFLHSLSYAKDRPQGRSPENKNPTSPQISIVNHSDVKRLLLAQKATVEGSLALELYCSWLLDQEICEKDSNRKRELNNLLEILTPVAKSWPSEFCLEANKHAIQVLGGYGYTRDFPLERFYRDNRLNPIHEGTHGIQSIDLLGRKVSMGDGFAFDLLKRELKVTISEGSKFPSLKSFSDSLKEALFSVSETTEILNNVKRERGSEIALANSGLYLDTFGHLVLAWIWLKIGVTIFSKEFDKTDENFYKGKLQALQYFYNYEVPSIKDNCQLLKKCDTTCLETNPEWF